MAGLPSHGGRRPRCIVAAGRRATCGRRGARGRRRLYFHGAQGCRRRRRYKEAIPALPQESYRDVYVMADSWNQCVPISSVV